MHEYYRWLAYLANLELGSWGTQIGAERCQEDIVQLEWTIEVAICISNYAKHTAATEAYRTMSIR